jgi:1-deoxy-D-xylulose-5-phosphate reductoisomerase
LVHREEENDGMAPREVVILGSTGSVGTQAIDIVKRNPDKFRVVGLAAGGSDPGMLAAQALDLGVDVVAVAKAGAAEDLLLAFYAAARHRGFSAGEYPVPKVLAGPDAATEIATVECDVVLNAITGSIGLRPTLAALGAGRKLALANKESLIVGGPLVVAAARPGQIVPVDSEHSALAQCLRGGRQDEVSRLILTASGGPFRGRARDTLGDITPEQALTHPTWNMGPLVTVNSATLVNKGLEVIEAHLLFGIPFDAIEVIVHPQSIVHSMVEFTDGATVAQLSLPDMRLPIGYALSYPERITSPFGRIDWSTLGRLDFEPPDRATFRCLGLAYAAGRLGGTAPAWLNAANEVVVAAFLDGLIPWILLADVLERVLSRHDGAAPDSLAAVIDADRQARRVASDVIEKELQR